MHCRSQTWLIVFVAGCLPLLTGCAETIDNVDNVLTAPWRAQREAKLNVKTPAMRTKELKQVAASAGRKSPAEKQKICVALAKEIQFENDPAMRRQILRTLAAFDTPLASAVLTAGLGDDNVDVRVVACQGLGKQGGKNSAAVEELARVANSDTSLDVRIAAVRALGTSKNQAALIPLADVMADADPAVQFRAKESLKLVSGRDYGDDLEAWRAYAKSGPSEAKPVSIAERFRQSLR